MFGKLPKGIRVKPAPMDNPTGEFICLDNAPDDRVLLYFHGGGYAMGTCRAHRTVVANFAKGTGINALTFEYRLAPEHPFPAALDDAVAAYTWLLEHGYAADQVGFIGDSAGAGLVLATLLALKERGMPLPAAAVAQSPWTDLTLSGDSNKTPDPLAWEGSWEVFGDYYAGDNDKRDPLISPLFGDLAGLPPLFIAVGQREAILDDSVRFAEKAQAAGTDVTLRVGEGMIHCYPTLASFFPEAKRTFTEICEFLREHLGVAQVRDGGISV